MVSFCAVGDIMLGDSEKCIGYGTRSIVERFGYDYPFEETDNFLKADIVFGNLEAVLSDYGFDEFDMFSAQMRAVPTSTAGLEKKFNVLNIANNHMMQHGEICFRETIDNLLKRNIGVVGLKGNGFYSSKPYIKKVSELTIGFLGYAFEKDLYSKNPLYAIGNEDDILKDVRRLKLDVDVVIVSCHWGDEFIDRPSIEVIRLAKKIIDNGANIIVGHHPHVVQPVEFYNNGIIAYSLGNFVSDMAWDTKLLTGLVLNIELDKNKTIFKKSFLFKNIKPSRPILYKEVACDNIQKNYNLHEIDLAFYEKEYLVELNRLLKFNRIKTYLYLLKNFQRMKKEIFFQILARRISPFLQ